MCSYEFLFTANFTLQNNNFTGQMPQSICNLTSGASKTLLDLWADCSGSSPKVNCSCCSKCF